VPSGPLGPSRRRSNRASIVAVLFASRWPARAARDNWRPYGRGLGLGLGLGMGGVIMVDHQFGWWIGVLGDNNAAISH
jgi:hypothetical protein